MEKQEQLSFREWMKKVNMTSTALVIAFKEECDVKVRISTITEWRRGTAPKWTRHIQAIEKISGMKIREFSFDPR